ncbi:hypothetical protein VD0002_g3747 [Verticillium dahliae]|uniref:Plasma membrane zinc ion transporter n=2 Tax=Verticillium dahliae TaxID=27337 RepID=G2X0R9_VERDV|nr:plasma membrane zinc ion transporter [Verticillium dahliae VdLs.17]KAF3343908.1 Choline transport protein [Verticillium dahliae VDG2]KAH6704822.1 plasma membrane zinc ion transporter [Verticillium dahliae]EGY22410.1 plasma membrane zinc ion transporter [Verticillium dahliae VdLs.17]PNH33480.1 hypothetical protein BJF96_g3052 [Verticillium dahliae]PNH42633.1 hypothetical protein VD0003_g9762 [Verticillium dahliae]
MNCPSRNDGLTISHPNWNQSPPYLAADLTTCEDLNGKANARERRDDASGGGGGNGGPASELDADNHFTHARCMPADQATAGPDARSGRCVGIVADHLRMKDVLGGEDQPRSHAVIHHQAASSARSAWGWITWTASVLACSLILSNLRTSGIPFLSSPSASSSSLSGLSPPHASPAVQCAPVTPVTPVVARPMTRRDSTCGGGGANIHEYDLPLHVGALFIILAVSLLACAFPIIAKKVRWMRIPPNFFFAVRHFGTGVLIATAFVHLLPTAFGLLGDPCLSSFWTTDYPAMPGAIALAAVFFVAIIEMVFQPARHIIPDGPVHREATSANSDDDGDDMDMAPPVVHGHRRGTSNSLGRQLSRISQTADITTAPIQPPVTPNKEARTIEDALPLTSSHGLTPAQQHQKAILQCMMLEVGILFHSIFIGMTLAVSVGSNFVILTIAIAFHQTFEGLALGSRIGAIDWHEGALQPWLMALAYGCTTPLGQAIGIATHRLYDPSSEFGLVLVGTMNAISSGLLVFASLVELLSEDFLSDESWKVLRGGRRIVACVLVFLGAFGMSVVGAWA